MDRSFTDLGQLAGRMIEIRSAPLAGVLLTAPAGDAPDQVLEQVRLVLLAARQLVFGRERIPSEISPGSTQPGVGLEVAVL